MEDLYTQQASYWMFGFILASILIFSVIATFIAGRLSSLKPAEKAMVIAIFMGLAFAVVYAAAQMLFGYLI